MVNSYGSHIRNVINIELMFSKACTKIQKCNAIIYYFTFQSNFPNNTFFYFPKTHYSVFHYFATSKKRAVPNGAMRLSFLLKGEKYL